MAFWMNIHGCQLHPKIAIYVVKQLKNDSYRQGLNHTQHIKLSFYENQSLNRFISIFSSKLRGVGDLFKRALMACYLLKILEMTPFFYNGGSDPHNVKLVDKVAMGAVLLRHLQNLPCNAHEVTELELGPTSSSSVTGSMSSTPRDSTIHEIGAAAFSTLSLINHSCDPNVVRHYYS